MLRMLIDAGADGRARDASGQTALFVAARQAPLDVVKMLVLEAFVNPMEKDEKGQLAEKVAKRAKPSAQAGVADFLSKATRGSIASANLPRRKYQLNFFDPLDESGNKRLLSGTDDYATCFKHTQELLPWLRSPHMSSPF